MTESLKASATPATNISVVLAGGGSAGHVSPLLAIAAAIRQVDARAAILAVGTAAGLETRLVPAAGFDLATIERVPMPRRPSADFFRLPGRMRKAISHGKKLLQDAQADVLVGVGGYVCTPMYLAAKSLGVPIVIHEANTKAGLANKVGARYSDHVGTVFAATRIKHGKLVGMPMRKSVATLNRESARLAAMERLNLDPMLPTLVVTGGSLGAVRLNNAVSGAAATLGAAGIQTLHITGLGKAVTSEDGKPFKAPLYNQVEYVDVMEDVYAAADLMLCRSGAGTVSEIAAVGLPAVFVPLPIGNGEQARNAAELVSANAALIVADSALDAQWIETNVLPLALDSARLAQMSKNAGELGIRDAAEVMARMVFDACTKERKSSRK